MQADLFFKKSLIDLYKYTNLIIQIIIIITNFK
jgi:hypothetical protein